MKRMRRCRLMGALVALLCMAQAPPGIGGDFTLVDGAGRIVTSTDFRGRFLLVMFGYTACPDVCPATLSKIAQALRLLGPKAADLRVVFITIDPQRDTPELTSRYAALFSGQITGLSGTPAQVHRAEADFHVYVGPKDVRSGAIAHGTLLYLMDPAGHFVTALPDGLSADELAAHLAAMLQGG
jgi:protein SCO1